MGHLGDNTLIFPRILSLREDPMLGQPLLEEWGLLGMFGNDGSAGLQVQGPAEHQGNLYSKNHMYINRHGGLNSRRSSSN